MVGDIEQLKSLYHQDTPDAMRRVVVAPTTPTFSLPPTLLRELAHTTRGLGLRLHTHLSETQKYVNFCREQYNCLPVEFVAEHEWLGPDVWFAHAVHLQPAEIHMLAQTATGIAHCPVSNARLAAASRLIPALPCWSWLPASASAKGTSSASGSCRIHRDDTIATGVLDASPG
jgi:cytosine/adenosine deaminase-related metal-dependent hydrolase